MNTFQVDLEPWYCNYPMDRWDEFEGSVAETTGTILDLLDQTDNRATFFALPEVFRRHPEVLDRIEDGGHEVASHGWSHTNLRELDRAAFEREIGRSLDALAEVGVTDVAGFRAPQFSLDRETSWMLEVLDDAGFAYDSSLFPTRTPLYGVPDAPREPYRVDYDTLGYGPSSNLLEVPLSTVSFPAWNLPVAGGLYLRAIPSRALGWCYDRIAAEGLPLVCYVHPPELDPDLPRPPEYGRHQFYNVAKTEAKLRRLLADYEFGTTRALLEEWG